MQPDLENMNDHDLCNLLVVKTSEFIKLHDQRNADNRAVSDCDFLVLTIVKIKDAPVSKRAKTGTIHFVLS